MNKKFVENKIKAGETFALYFYKVDCPFCEKISPLLGHTIPPGKYNSKEVPLFKINQKGQKELLDMMDIKNYPTILLIKGTNFIRLEGFNEINSYING